MYRLVRPLLFRVDPETGHRYAIAALRHAPGWLELPRANALATHVAGIDFPNPLGLAAGFDKNGEATEGIARLQFGFSEVGSVTPRPQAGNPKPRLFRLAQDGAIINRMGFNNHGLDAVYERLAATRERSPGLVIGVNVGANKDSADRTADYIAGLARMADVASYLAVNISSPNTPGLRDLQEDRQLEQLLAAISVARKPHWPPIFLKVAPDLGPEAPARIAEAVLHHDVDGLIVSNTTIARPRLHGRHAAESGGLSGAPLHDLALESLRRFRKATGGRVPLRGVGGIAPAAPAGPTSQPPQMRMPGRLSRSSWTKPARAAPASTSL